TSSSTSWGHENSALGMTVGAAPYFSTPPYGANPPLKETFSSAGGMTVYFDTAGNPINGGAGVVRNRPDIVAPDGVSTTVSGFGPFFGTSAAAPHAAAVAALLRQARPSATTTQIFNAM